MDYAQNISLAQCTDTPSQWFFWSLWSVSGFVVYYAGTQRQLNYVYSDRKGDKGPNEVFTLLMSYLDDHEFLEVSDRILTEYGGNCGGQNKNNFVVKLFVLLAQIGYFKHTPKNLLNELYKNLPASQKYQIFSASSASPGMESPGSDTHSFDIRRAHDNEKVSSSRALQLLNGIAKLTPPKIKNEKVCDIYKNIVPYVPKEYLSDPLYKRPTEEQLAACTLTKKSRRKAGTTEEEDDSAERCLKQKREHE
ncbi:TPA: hypothetical protein N0F65_005349 [Lagenidium giganteum]|uniref:Uncharacterized protein n=1 Tax=Lagenidium giganteum TaxID=4803 RepID=A0AAV2YYG9_9STRA|nr:TPA: hypothetical protein N0F65_005349 [Lagenidium giganteum]